MQIRKILLPIIFGLFLNLTNASEVSFGYDIGEASLDQVVQDLKAKNVQYEMAEENCENGSDKCVRRIIIKDNEYLGYKAQTILYFNHGNNLRVSQAIISDDHYPGNSNSIFMKIGEKISKILYGEGVKFASKLNYSIKFPEGQKKGTFVRTFCDFDAKKAKDFLCVTVVSKEPHNLLTVIASVAETVNKRTDIWIPLADYWEGIR